MVIASKEVTNSIVQAIKRHLPYPHYRVFYFGSRVSGKASPRSDYDVGVEADQKIPFGFMAKIEDELDEIPILQKIDLVDFRSVAKNFYNFAKKNIEIIYEQ